MPDDPTLDWSTATVKDGKLKVEVAGEPPDDWTDAFERSVKLLHGGGSGWGEVRLKKNEVRVADVTPGSEEKLRHFLEGVVQQANTPRRGDDSEHEDDDAPATDTPDGQMTQRFREFGEDADSED